MAAAAIEAALFVGGLGVLAGVLLTEMEACYTQRAVHEELYRATADMVPSPRPVTAPAGKSLPALVGEWVPHVDMPIVGELIVPRLAASAPLLEGTANRTLRLGAGHLPQTPLPWEAGNSAFAGHRDTFFRTLRLLQVGDALDVVTPRGTFRYRVSHLRVVDPEDVWVLHPGLASLTLITCYPFTYVGGAPHRFIVQADRSDGPGSPDR